MEIGLVSVVVPVYNAEEYLRECLNSIVNQTYKQLEIIIIDDGSTDQSLSICKEFCNDSRVKLFTNKNHGLSFTRQYGLDLANGEYFTSYDADDYLAPSMIEEMVIEIEKKNADICICGRIDFVDNTVLGRVSPKNIYVKLDEACITSSYRNYATLFSASDTWNKLYRKNFIDSTGVKFIVPSHFNGTDLLFNHALLLYLPTVITLDNDLYYHRIVQGSKVHRKGKNLQKGFQFIINKLFEFTKECNIRNKKELYKQLMALYYSLLFDAALDVIYETEEKKQSDVIIEFIKNHEIFIDSLPGNHSYCKKGLNEWEKIFTWLLKNRSKYQLLIFLKLRNYIQNNIKNKGLNR